MVSCPFCLTENLTVLRQTSLSISFRDIYPVSKGHTLIIPRRHVVSFFELTPEEQVDLLGLTTLCKKSLDEEYFPSGYNIGVNDGESAGQTIKHVHMHLIPRYSGDMPDPRGGIRWIFPDSAIYWEKGK